MSYPLWTSLLTMTRDVSLPPNPHPTPPQRLNSLSANVHLAFPLCPIPPSPPGRPSRPSLVPPFASRLSPLITHVAS